jgi:hypothetical protein
MLRIRDPWKQGPESEPRGWRATSFAAVNPTIRPIWSTPPRTAFS